MSMADTIVLAGLVGLQRWVLKLDSSGHISADTLPASRHHCSGYKWFRSQARPSLCSTLHGMCDAACQPANFALAGLLGLQRWGSSFCTSSTSCYVVLLENAGYCLPAMYWLACRGAACPSQWLSSCGGLFCGSTQPSATLAASPARTF